MTDLTDPVQPAFLDHPGSYQGLLLLVGRLDSKMDLMLSSNTAQDVRLQRLEQIVVPRDEVDGIARRVTALEAHEASTRGFLRAVVMIGGPLTALIGGISHYVAQHLFK